MPSSKKKITTKTTKKLRFEENADGEPLARTRSGNTYYQSHKLLAARAAAKKRNPNIVILSPELSAVRIESDYGEVDWPSRGTVDTDEYFNVYGNNKYFWSDADKMAAQAEVAKERAEAMAAEATNHASEMQLASFQAKVKYAQARQAAREAKRQAEAEEYCKNESPGCLVMGGKKTRRHHKKNAKQKWRPSNSF